MIWVNPTDLKTVARNALGESCTTAHYICTEATVESPPSKTTAGTRNRNHHWLAWGKRRRAVWK